MLRLLAVPLAALAVGSSIEPLPTPLKSELNGPFWHAGCPVPLGRLRVLTVTYWGFDGRPHAGELVVHQSAAAPLQRVFGKLYSLRFPIRHLQVEDSYGPTSSRPVDGDVSGSFACREAVRSPCSTSKRTGTGTWSNHAYGLAVDLNPRENPYVGCGRNRDPARIPFLDRTRLRPGMVTPAVVAAFRSIGWGWGGSWSGSTKDYMHFSVNGH